MRNERKLNEMHIAPGNQGNPDKKCRKWEILNTVSQFQWKLYISECLLCIITQSVFALPENCPVNAKKGANNSEKKTLSNFTVKWARVWGCKKHTQKKSNNDNSNSTTAKWPYPKKRTRIAVRSRVYLIVYVCACECTTVQRMSSTAVRIA